MRQLMLHEQSRLPVLSHGPEGINTHRSAQLVHAFSVERYVHCLATGQHYAHSAVRIKAEKLLRLAALGL